MVSFPKLANRFFAKITVIIAIHNLLQCTEVSSQSVLPITPHWAGWNRTCADGDALSSLAGAVAHSADSTRVDLHAWLHCAGVSTATHKAARSKCQVQDAFNLLHLDNSKESALVANVKFADRHNCPPDYYVTGVVSTVADNMRMLSLVCCKSDNAHYVDPIGCHTAGPVDVISAFFHARTGVIMPFACPKDVVTGVQINKQGVALKYCAITVNNVPYPAVCDTIKSGMGVQSVGRANDSVVVRMDKPGGDAEEMRRSMLAVTTMPVTEQSQSGADANVTATTTAAPVRNSTNVAELLTTEHSVSSIATSTMSTPSPPPLDTDDYEEQVIFLKGIPGPPGHIEADAVAEGSGAGGGTQGNGVEVAFELDGAEARSAAGNRVEALGRTAGPLACVCACAALCTPPGVAAADEQLLRNVVSISQVTHARLSADQPVRVARAMTDGTSTFLVLRDSDEIELCDPAQCLCADACKLR